VINRSGVAIPRPAGLADLRALILRLAGASVPQAAPDDVFQYVGELDTPSSIALVQASGRRTVLNLETEEVSSSAGGEVARYRQLDRNSELAHLVQQVIRRWESERWTRRNALTLPRRRDKN
jgi:hypothetical protein